MKKELSRALELDVEKCIKESGVGRFELVLLAAQRAREIKNRSKNSDDYNQRYTVLTALLEIQKGK